MRRGFWVAVVMLGSSCYCVGWAYAYIELLLLICCYKKISEYSLWKGNSFIFISMLLLLFSIIVKNVLLKSEYCISHTLNSWNKCKATRCHHICCSLVSSIYIYIYINNAFLSYLHTNFRICSYSRSVAIAIVLKTKHFHFFTCSPCYITLKYELLCSSYMFFQALLAYTTSGF
jgi:hypothetical protein